MLNQPDSVTYSEVTGLWMMGKQCVLFTETY